MRGGTLIAVTVLIYDHDPAWPAQAAAAGAELAATGLFSVVEHIGSTSVAGLAAKPVIDLMAATPELAEVLAAEATLRGLGYERHETGMRNRLFYQFPAGGDRSGRPETAGRQLAGRHLHVVTEDSWPTRNERLLRDHLRAHPRDAARYAALKRELQAAGYDADAYTRAKTELIQELVDRVRTDRGLPLESVWED